MLEARKHDIKEVPLNLVDREAKVLIGSSMPDKLNMIS